MKKFKFLFLLLLFALVTFMVPKDVDAVSSVVSFKTTIEDWKTNSSLQFACGSNDANVVPTVYVGTSLNNLQPQASCNFNFNTLGFSDGDTIYVVERYDFSSYSGTNPEYQSISVTPGHVVDPDVDYDDDDYMFGDYDIDDKILVLYNMNQTDNDGNITGGLYVYDAYYDDNGEKATEVDLGEVKMPSYCVNVHFTVKGNIADTYGLFTLTALAHDDFAITGENGDVVNICDIDGDPLTKQQFDALVGTDATYTGVSREDDYTISVTDDGVTVDGQGVNSTELYVVASLESDGSQTGLIYTILPFVLLIAMVTIGYLIIKRNNVDDEEII